MFDQRTNSLYCKEACAASCTAVVGQLLTNGNFWSESRSGAAIEVRDYQRLEGGHDLQCGSSDFAHALSV